MEPAKTVVVYDLRYVLSTGATKVEAIPAMFNNMILARSPHIILRPRDWAETEEEAKQKFETQKLAKIKQLRKALDCLANTEFEVAG